MSVEKASDQASLDSHLADHVRQLIAEGDVKRLKVLLTEGKEGIVGAAKDVLAIFAKTHPEEVRVPQTYEEAQEYARRALQTVMGDVNAGLRHHREEVLAGEDQPLPDVPDFFDRDWHGFGVRMMSIRDRIRGYPYSIPGVGGGVVEKGKKGHPHTILARSQAEFDAAIKQGATPVVRRNRLGVF